MSLAHQHKYDNDGLPILSILETVSLTLAMLRMPFVLLWKAIWSKMTKDSKPTNRVLFEASSRHVLGNLSIAQLQRLSGTSIGAYKSWANTAKQEPVIEDVDGGARLYWIGDKHADYIMLYCHGGGFVGPLSDFQCKFNEYIRDGFAKSSATLGVAILDYSVYPNKFPTQLLQLSATVEYLFVQGISPERLFISGESAGANIIVQLLSHILHPLPGISAPPTLSAPLAGVLLYSPWAALVPTAPSVTANHDKDLVTSKTLHLWGAAYRADVPDSQLPYVEPLGPASSAWYQGVKALTRRLFVTAGEYEVLRDDAVRFADMLKEVHDDVYVEVESGAVHADMIFDVAAKSKTLSPMTVRVTEWLIESSVAKKAEA